MIDDNTEKNSAKEELRKLKKLCSGLQAKLNRTDMKILNSRLLTLKEITINKEISVLRSELAKNQDCEELGKKIKNKINILNNCITKKDNLEKIYILRNTLIKNIEYASMKILELTENEK